jgi:putative sensory transduction regulator
LAVSSLPTRRVTASHVDDWLSDLGLESVERAERSGTTSWDLLLDGRRRRDVRVTLILEPTLALVAWVHYAPALNDGFRRSYRQFLRWNDEFPFAKFALSEDERPVLTTELPLETADSNALGLALARLLTICDLLLDDSARWLWPGGRMPSDRGGARRNNALFERYATELGELGELPEAG